MPASPRKSTPEGDAARAGDSDSSPLDAGLYVVATPIGNLGDITLRALSVLRRADLVLCEDTRVSAKLFDRFGLRPQLLAYHDHNAASVRPRALRRLGEGAAVALISDAGTPLVSDPGYKLVREAIEAGHRVVPVPGASAALAALVSAGLPSDRFFFEGFLPTKSGQRRSRVAELAAVPATLIFYETGPRLAASLRTLADELGARPAAVCRELTKAFEEVRRGPLDELARHFEGAGPPKGEVVVVVGPPPDTPALSPETVDARIESALARMSVRDAASLIADESGLPRREVYRRALALAHGGKPK